MTIDRYKKLLRLTGIVSIIALVLSIILFYISKSRSGVFDAVDEILLALDILFFCVHFGALFLLVIIAVFCHPTVVTKSEKLRKNIQENEQKIIDMEYQQALASQNLTEPWATHYESSSCPYCGHYKVRIAKWEDKRTSIAFWGIASDKIGKQYICDNCKKTW